MYRVVVPLDGSPDAEEALDVARVLNATGRGAVDLVHVLVADRKQHDPWNVRKEAAETYLDAIARTFPHPSSVRTGVLRGHPADSIGAFIRSTGSNVLIIAPRWSEDRNGFAPDSTSRELMETSPIPTILVPLEAHASFSRLRNVLVLISGDPDGDELAAIDWLAPLDPLFRLISVIPGNGHVDIRGRATTEVHGAAKYEHTVEMRQSALLRLNRALARKGLRSNWEVRHGGAVSEILRAADTTETDLIVFTSTTSDTTDPSRMGDTALSVARRSRVPVLAFPGYGGAQSWLGLSRNGAPARS